MIEVPESFCSLVHGCLDFVYPCHDFDPHFLKELIDLLLVGSIWLLSCRERSYLLEKLGVIGERPVPENCLEIAGCKLGNGQEVFGLEGLFHYAELAFEDQIVCASRISGKVDALLISVARTY